MMSKTMIIKLSTDDILVHQLQNPLKIDVRQRPQIQATLL